MVKERITIERHELDRIPLADSRPSRTAIRQAGRHTANICCHQLKSRRKRFYSRLIFATRRWPITSSRAPSPPPPSMKRWPNFRRGNTITASCLSRKPEPRTYRTYVRDLALDPRLALTSIEDIVPAPPDPCWLLQDRPMAGRRQANVIDSTGFLELVAFPEERLGIEIDFLEARRFQQDHSAGG